MLKSGERLNISVVAIIIMSLVFEAASAASAGPN